jgi:hypothetical protein
MNQSEFEFVEALDSLPLSKSISVGSEDSLLRIILKLGSGYRDFLRPIQLKCLNEDGLSLLDEHLGIPPESVRSCAVERVTHPPFPLNSIPPFDDSRIIADFLEIFAEFRKKQFALLWRGIRDGVKAQEFDRRCDGHGNTLTMILKTKGNIFGGFTPVEWESRDWHFKADDSLKSFRFTLKNPHNLSTRSFSFDEAQIDRW